MNGNRTKKIIFTVIAACWMLFIWGQSAMPADVSSQESMSILNMLPEFLRGVTEYAIRKSAHFAEYLALGILLKIAFSCWKKQLGTVLLAGVLCALVDETIQLFAAGRSSQVSDVWLDLFGFCAGAALHFIGSSLIRKLKGTIR